MSFWTKARGAIVNIAGIAAAPYTGGSSLAVSSAYNANRTQKAQQDAVKAQNDANAKAQADYAASQASMSSNANTAGDTAFQRLNAPLKPNAGGASIQPVYLAA